ncbi:MAG: hypothetical protein WC209_17580 [Ignavibacteriaceae bacterium]|jgi:hypothetical protein
MKTKLKFIALNLLFGISFLFGQENSNVELPQFVITGKEAYEFPQLEKQKPELVSSVSEQFFKPVYSSDELEVKEFSEPAKKSGEFLDSISFINGEAEFLIGNNLLPSLSITYRMPMERSMFSANINAVNQRAFLPYADMNKFGAKLLYNYIISDSSSFLPFSKLQLSAKGESESYKLFGSSLPSFNRKVSRVSVSTSLANVTSNKFNYDLTLENNYLNMSNDSIKENLFKVNGFTKYSSKLFDLSLYGKYHLLQSTFLSLAAENFAFISAKGMCGFKFGNSVKTDFGFEYSKLDSNNSFYPYAAAAIQLWKGFSLFAEYHPTSLLITQYDLLNTNRYYIPTIAHKNIFYSITSQYNFNFKYEYERLFEFTTGISLFSASNYPYFAQAASGVNDLVIDTAEVKATTVSASVRWFAGMYGFFSGSLLYQNIQDTAGNTLPNIAPLKASASYGYNISQGISLSAEMMYYSSPFINFANIEKGKDYFNLSLKGEMIISEKMFAQLEFRNLLNAKNEIWKNYQELPLTISAGLKIIW